MSGAEKFDFDFPAIIQRIKQILDVRNDKDVAIALGLNPNSFFNRKKRGSVPMAEIVNFGNTHNVNLDWLINGNGLVYNEPLTQTSNGADVISIDPVVQILHEALEETGVEINEKQKKACLEILREELSKSDSKTKDDIKKYLKAFGK